MVDRWLSYPSGYEEEEKWNLFTMLARWTYIPGEEAATFHGSSGLACGMIKKMHDEQHHCSPCLSSILMQVQCRCLIVTREYKEVH